jgi:hypothetical protein
MKIFFKSLIFFLIFLNCSFLNSNNSNLSQDCSYLYNQVDLIDEKKNNNYKYGLKIYTDLPLAVEYYMLLENKAYFLTLLQQDCKGVEINTNEYTFDITTSHINQKISLHNYEVNILEEAWLTPCLDNPEFNSSDDCYFAFEGYASVMLGSQR